MRISEIIERFGRTVFEAPFGAMAQTIGDSPEVAEIRIAVLDDVRKRFNAPAARPCFRTMLCGSAFAPAATTRPCSSAISSASFSRKKCVRDCRRSLPVSGRLAHRDPRVR